MATRLTIESLTGSTYAICATLPTTYDAAGYGLTSLVYTAIGSVETVTNYGAKRSVTMFMPISGATQKVKGTPDYGVLTMTYGDVPTDAGQIIAKAAEASPNHYTIKITYPDGEIHYLDILNSSYEYQGAKAGDVKKVIATLNICAAPVIIAAP